MLLYIKGVTSIYKFDLPFAQSLLIFGLLCLFNSPLQAQRWISFDTSARGMGQAGVAHIDSPAAIYWNPANIPDRQQDTVQTQLDGIVDVVVEGNVLFNADRLNDLLETIDLDAIQDRFNQAVFTTEDVEDMYRITESLSALTEPGAGVVSDVGGSFSVQYKKWIYSYRYLSRIGLSAVLSADADANLSLSDEGLSDLNNGLDQIIQQRLADGDPLSRPVTSQGQQLSQRLQTLGADFGVNITADIGDEFAFLGEQALGPLLDDPRFLEFFDQVLLITANTNLTASPSVIANNDSGIVIKGINLHDVTVGRSFVVPSTNNRLRFGISGRLIRGNTFLRRTGYRNLDNGKALLTDVFKAFNEGNRVSYQATVDAGLSYTPHPRVTLGLTGRNLVPHHFKYRDDTRFEINPRVRAGIAVRPLDWLTLSLDSDLFNNSTSALPGYDSQILGGGFEATSRFGGFNVAFRGGMFTNLAVEDSDEVYTLGFELRRGAVTISTEGHMTATEINVEAPSEGSRLREFPDRVGGSISIGLEF